MLLLAACAQQPTQVVKLYESEGADRHFDTLLVIGIADDPSTRRNLEDMVAAGIKDRGANSVAGHTHTGPGTTLLQSAINEAASQAGADGILVSHIASVDTQMDVEAGRTEVYAECRGGDPADYFLYDYEELQVPDTVRVAHTVVVISNLYDVQSGERVWTIQSTCFNKSTMNEALVDEAEAIARQLMIDDLVG